MAEFFLKLGHIDKKLIMIIITTILYFIMDIIDYYSGMSDLHFSDPFSQQKIFNRKHTYGSLRFAAEQFNAVPV